MKAKKVEKIVRAKKVKPVVIEPIVDAVVVPEPPLVEGKFEAKQVDKKWAVVRGESVIQWCADEQAAKNLADGMSRTF
jgi:hypothetical protein